MQCKVTREQSKRNETIRIADEMTGNGENNGNGNGNSHGNDKVKAITCDGKSDLSFVIHTYYTRILQRIASKWHT